MPDPPSLEPSATVLLEANLDRENPVNALLSRASSARQRAEMQLRDRHRARASIRPSATTPSASDPARLRELGSPLTLSQSEAVGLVRRLADEYSVGNTPAAPVTPSRHKDSFDANPPLLRYLADTLCHLPYTKEEEVLTVVTAISRIASLHSRCVRVCHCSFRRGFVGGRHP